MKEEWRDIKDYEGLYQVSNLGRVKSLGNGKSNNSKRKIMKQHYNQKGYLLISLTNNGEKSFQVHRLVAQAFIPNPNNLPQVNHKDENKENNFVYINEDGTIDLEKSNLEWCDNYYNSHYGTRFERIFKKTTNGKCSKPVLQIDKNTNEVIAEFPSMAEVERQLGISNVSNCCTGKQKTCGGYKWQFKTTT